MTYSARLICMLFATGAVALPAIAAPHDAGNTIPTIQGQHYIAFDVACPGVAVQLSEHLYPAWRAIDSAANVLVDFRLDGSTISDVRISGGHGDYVVPVRRAVRAMRCSSTGPDGAAVRLRIAFEYPEDGRDVPVAMRLINAGPLVTTR